jgi:hypothetical protein
MSNIEGGMTEICVWLLYVICKLLKWLEFCVTLYNKHISVLVNYCHFLRTVLYSCITVDSRLSARCLTALRLNRGNVFLKIFFFQWVSHLFKCFVWQSMLVYYNLERTVLAFTSSIDILPLFFLKARNQVSKARNLPFFQQVENVKEPWPARSHKSVWCETSISKGTNKDQTQAPVNL